jgi:xanthine dehydrogenase accessory factor
MTAAEPEPAEPPRVVVHGNTPIARAVLSVAVALGYHAVAFDGPVSPGGISGPPGCPGDTPGPPGLENAAAVVSATHGGPDEEAVLRAALAAGVPYVGLVASRRRGQAVVAGMGLDAAAAGRLHTPAGLDIGARTPEEVALAILAEVVATRPRLPGQSRAARGKNVCDHRRASGSE